MWYPKSEGTVSSLNDVEYGSLEYGSRKVNALLQETKAKGEKAAKLDKEMKELLKWQHEVVGETQRVLMETNATASDCARKITVARGKARVARRDRVWHEEDGYMKRMEHRKWMEKTAVENQLKREAKEQDMKAEMAILHHVRHDEIIAKKRQGKAVRTSARQEIHRLETMIEEGRTELEGKHMRAEEASMRAYETKQQAQAALRDARTRLQTKKKMAGKQDWFQRQQAIPIDEPLPDYAEINTLIKVERINIVPVVQMIQQIPSLHKIEEEWKEKAPLLKFTAAQDHELFRALEVDFAERTQALERQSDGAVQTLEKKFNFAFDELEKQYNKAVTHALVRAQREREAYLPRIAEAEDHVLRTRRVADERATEMAALRIQMANLEEECSTQEELLAEQEIQIRKQEEPALYGHFRDQALDVQQAAVEILPSLERGQIEARIAAASLAQPTFTAEPRDLDELQLFELATRDEPTLVGTGSEANPRVPELHQLTHGLMDLIRAIDTIGQDRISDDGEAEEGEELEVAQDPWTTEKLHQSGQTESTRVPDSTLSTFPTQQVDPLGTGAFEDEFAMTWPSGMYSRTDTSQLPEGVDTSALPPSPEKLDALDALGASGLPPVPEEAATPEKSATPERPATPEAPEALEGPTPSEPRSEARRNSSVVIHEAVQLALEAEAEAASSRAGSSRACSRPVSREARPPLGLWDEVEDCWEEEMAARHAPRCAPSPAYSLDRPPTPPIPSPNASPTQSESESDDSSVPELPFVPSRPTTSASRPMSRGVAFADEDGATSRASRASGGASREGGSQGGGSREGSRGSAPAIGSRSSRGSSRSSQQRATIAAGAIQFGSEEVLGVSAVFLDEPTDDRPVLEIAKDGWAVGSWEPEQWQVGDPDAEPAELSWEPRSPKLQAELAEGEPAAPAPAARPALESADLAVPSTAGTRPDDSPTRAAQRSFQQAWAAAVAEDSPRDASCWTASSRSSSVVLRQLVRDTVAGALHSGRSYSASEVDDLSAASARSSDVIAAAAATCVANAIYPPTPREAWETPRDQEVLTSRSLICDLAAGVAAFATRVSDSHSPSSVRSCSHRSAGNGMVDHFPLPTGRSQSSNSEGENDHFSTLLVQNLLTQVLDEEESSQTEVVLSAR